MRNLYRGVLLHQGLWGPFNAVFFPLYERSKRAWTEGGVGVAGGLGATAVCSLVSAAVAGLVTNPMDVVKVRLQTNPGITSARECAQLLWAHEGAGGFMRGAGARVLWISPSLMLTMTLFEAFSLAL